MRIVIVSNPARPDFFNYILHHFSTEHELYILWDYEKGDSIRDFGYQIKFLYWKDFVTPKSFLQKVKPDRVLFFEIIDFWQIPLIIACHHFKVSSFFIEHGVGNSIDMVVSRFNEIPSIIERFVYYLKKIFFRLPRIIKNRIFFFSAAQYLSKEDKKFYFKLPFYYKKFTPIHALSQLKFRHRTPHFAILFNNNNIAPFLFYNIIEQNNIFTGGVPFFDKYFTKHATTDKHIVFIEHPYLEFKMLEWSNEFHESIARTLETFAIKNNIRVIVKLHPFSQISNWTRYNLNPLIDIKQKEDVTHEFLSAKLVLGYSSTLINALIACKKNIVLLGWHPKQIIQGDDFSSTGLCHVSFNMTELTTKYDEWLRNNLSLTNKSSYDDFIREYNYPMDGKATNRVLSAILNHEVS